MDRGGPGARRSLRGTEGGRLGAWRSLRGTDRGGRGAPRSPSRTDRGGFRAWRSLRSTDRGAAGARRSLRATDRGGSCNAGVNGRRGQPRSARCHEALEPHHVWDPAGRAALRNGCARERLVLRGYSEDGAVHDRAHPDRLRCTSPRPHHHVMDRVGWMLFLVVAIAGCSDDGEADLNGSTAESSATGPIQGEPMYCPGTAPSAEMACRTSEDCESVDEVCAVAPDDCPGPGCASDCEVDADCGVGGVCHTTGVGCCGDAGMCISACTADSCGAQFSCGASGHCVPVPCDAGHACAEGFRCDSGRPGADAHGCAPIPCDEAGALACSVVSECVGGACRQLACTLDTDCPCGTCMSGLCWERPWFCFRQPS